MSNEIVKPKNQLSDLLMTDIESKQNTLPEVVNQKRIVEGFMAYLNANNTIIDFAKTYGTEQIRSCCVKAVQMGFDPWQKHFYFIPYKNKLELMPSYQGSIYLAEKYAVRPVKTIYAEIVREGEEFSIEINGSDRIVHHKQNPFGGGKTVGVYAVVEYKDGGMYTETMNIEELNACKTQSKQINSIPWKKFEAEMQKKSCLKRCLKHVPLKFATDIQAQAFNEDCEIETDQKEIVRNDIKNVEVVQFDASRVIEE